MQSPGAARIAEDKLGRREGLRREKGVSRRPPSVCDWIYFL